MRRVRQKRTAAENNVATALHLLGIRYRRNVRGLPGSPDFANRSRGWVIFVNGCFWHRHRGCVRATTPTRNQAFWVDKFSSNVARDRVKARSLRYLGYRVFIVWECQTHDDARLRRRLAALKEI